MNKEDYILKITEKHKKEIEVLESVPSEFYPRIHFTNEYGNIYLTDEFNTVEQLKEFQSKLIKYGNWEITQYFMNNGNLFIGYKFKNFKFILYIEIKQVATEECLNYISSGKCKIVDKEIKTEKTITCNLEN